MPNKPTTLREEWKKYVIDNDNFESYDIRYFQEVIAIWWLDKFSSHSTELVKELERARKYSKHMSKTEVFIEGYNQALDQVISIINQEK